MSRLLAKHFRRSVTERSMIRGMPTRSVGFVVKDDNARVGINGIRVFHSTGFYCSNDRLVEQAHDALDGYVRVLSEKYAVEDMRDGRRDSKCSLFLIVTRKEAS